MSAESLENLAVWLDVPVVDLDRATRFYESVLGRDADRQSFDDCEFAVLMHESGNGACLVPSPKLVSRDQGILVYLNVNGRIRDAVEKVKENGGEVLEDVHAIGPHGFKAVAIDSEGNRIALHARTDC